MIRAAVNNAVQGKERHLGRVCRLHSRNPARTRARDAGKLQSWAESGARWPGSRLILTARGRSLILSRMGKIVVTSSCRSRGKEDSRYQKPGGLKDDDGVSALRDYPIDSLLIRNEGRSVFETIRRIKDESFIMDPDFQRDFVWDKGKQSPLIESVLMRIPLPVFYFAENKNGR